MGKKTNCAINGIPYFRKYATINGKRKMFYGDSEKDCLNKIKEAKELDDKGVINKKAALGKSIQEWVYVILPTDSKKSKSTYSIYEGIYRNQLRDAGIMNLKLLDIRKNNIQKFINAMNENGDSVSKMESAKKILSLFFKYAEDEGFVIKNPCYGVYIPKSDKDIDVVKDEDGDKIEVYSDEELIKINSAMSDNRMKFLVLLALATGMRVGEMCALRHKDFESNPLYINKSQKTIRHIKEGQATEYEIIDGSPKSKAGYRFMPLPDWILKEYDIHKKLCQIEKFSRGQGKLLDSDCVFLSLEGKRLTSQIQKEWEKITIAAEVKYKKFHSLRHACITKWVQTPGVKIVTVKELAGHSKLETTLKYTHIEMENKIEAINSSITNTILS